MDLRERFEEFLQSRAEGTVRFNASGDSRYYPPGYRVRVLGDTLAGLGVAPVAAFTILVYRFHIEGLSSIETIVGFGFVPLYAVFAVVACLVIPGWKSRAVVTCLGLIGTAFTVMWVGQLTGHVPALHQEWPWLGVGSVLILLGGSLATVAALYGEWAKQFDT